MDEKTLQTIIGELVGEASMCWTSDGVFDDVSANGVVVKLLALFHANESFYRVKQFHVVTGAPIREGLFTEEEIDLRVRLIDEEFKELKTGIKKWKAALPSGDVDALVEIADALADLDYVVNGAFVSFGLPGVAIEREVHRSNMTKLLPSGEALKRDDGKVLKGPDYEEPDLIGVMLRSGHLRGEYETDVEEGDEPLLVNIYVADEFYPEEG